MSWNLKGLERRVKGPKAWKFTVGSRRREQCDEGGSVVNLIYPTVGILGKTLWGKEELQGLLFESLVFGKEQRDGRVGEDSEVTALDQEEQ